MKTLTNDTTCPCGRRDARSKPLPYGACCGRWLESDAPAPDAESLMRSRYTAFVLGRADYLLATWHPAHRPAALDFDAGVKWLGLEVRDALLRDASHAEVEFVARQKPSTGAAVRLHERSRFLREAERWLYVDGDVR